MKASSIRILLLCVNAPPAVVTVENKLSALQALVGGYIEAVTVAENLMLICNEEGKLKQLPGNREVEFEGGFSDYIVGDFFFVRGDVESGEFIDLTDDDIKFLTATLYAGLDTGTLH